MPKSRHAQHSSYQPCRWYDTNPKLSFAMRLLGWAPNLMKHQAVQQLEQWVQTQVGETTLIDLIQAYEQDRLATSLSWNRRWYDEFDKGPLLFEVLKKTPNLTKNKIADDFLLMLKDVKTTID